MSLKCEDEKDIIVKTKELLENKHLQKEIIENQKRFISNNTCEKIVDFVLNEVSKGINNYDK